MRKFLKYVVFVVMFLLLIASALVRRYHDRPAILSLVGQQVVSYTDIFRMKGDTTQAAPFKVAWAKLVIPVSVPQEMAGYRPFRTANQVHDSLYIRILTLQKGTANAFVVSADWLLFPPELAKKVRALGLKNQIAPDQFFFSASHTHNGTGHWLNSVAAYFFGGGYQEALIDQLAGLIVKEAINTLRNAEESTISHFEASFPDLVRNRIHPNGQVDDVLRGIEWVTKSGKKGVLLSFGAHATCIKKAVPVITNDYPGELLSLLSADYDFATFIAGAVGSQRPHADYEDFEFSHYLGETLYKEISSISRKAVRKEAAVLKTGLLPIEFDQPGIRILNGWQLRPSIFNALLGEQTLYLSFLRISDIVLVGTPCDFSGELAIPLYQLAEKHGFHLWISSFNGGYMGYITPDHYFLTNNKSELREMRWTGPTSGSYLTQIIQKVISNETP